MSRTPRARLLLVLAAALAARLVFVARQGPPLMAGDALEYQTYASALLEKGRFEGFDGERAARMPGYPLFLAAAESALASPAAVPWLQALLGAATCVLVLSLAGPLVPAPWPLAAGLAAALSWDMVSPAGALLSETLYAFLLTLAFWTLLRERWSPARRALAFGAVSGAVYLVRPEPLPALGLAAAGLPLLLPRFRRQDAARAVLALGLVAALWVGRNALVFGRLVPASSVGGRVGYLTLYLPADQLGMIREERHQAPPGLGELERDADFKAAGRELAGRLTAAQRLKARLYNLAVIAYPFLPEYDWSWVFLAPLAAAGLWAARRRRELQLMAAVIAQSLLVFAFYGGPASRYRQGFFPLVVLLAAAGAAALEGALGKRRFRPALGAWLAANLLLWAFQTQARAGALALKAALLGR